MYTILVVVQVLVAISLIGLILIQHGKGADAGAAFGSGASGTVFGARGAANFLTRMTATLATVFFATSLGLAYLINDRTSDSSSVVDVLEAPSAPAPETAAPQDDDAAPGVPGASPGMSGAVLEETTDGSTVQSDVQVIAPGSEGGSSDSDVPTVPE